MHGQCPGREGGAGYHRAILRPHRPAIDPLMTHADELKSSGLKATLPRIKILEVFQRTSSAT
jgi:hypothetical protein